MISSVVGKNHDESQSGCQSQINIYQVLCPCDSLAILKQLNKMVLLFLTTFNFLLCLKHFYQVITKEYCHMKHSKMIDNYNMYKTITA